VRALRIDAIKVTNDVVIPGLASSVNIPGSTVTLNSRLNCQQLELFYLKNYKSSAENNYVNRKIATSNLVELFVIEVLKI